MGSCYQIVHRGWGVEMKVTMACATCLALVLASGVVMAQAGGIQQQNGIRVQIQPSLQRETSRNDFASLFQQGQARLDSLGSAIVVFDDLIDSPPPSGLSRRERSAWREQSEWLAEVRQRYQSFAERLSTQTSSASGLSGQAMMNEMTRMDMEFLSLQSEIQNASRRFQTLSNAMKARHDAAMSAIRNIK